MDFQSAMETFAEAWVAANAGQQTQALALTRSKSPGTVTVPPLLHLKKERSVTPPLTPPPSHQQVNLRESLSSDKNFSVSSMNQDDLSSSPKPFNSSSNIENKRMSNIASTTNNNNINANTSENNLRSSNQNSPIRNCNTDNMTNNLVNRTQTPIQRSSEISQQQQQPQQQHQHLQQHNILQHHHQQHHHFQQHHQEQLQQQQSNPFQNRNLATTPKVSTPLSVIENGLPTVGHPTLIPSVGNSLSTDKIMPSTVSAASTNIDRRDFDLTKVNAKSLPLHCIVESVPSLQASLAIDQRNIWKRRPNIETDSYVIIAASTPWSDIVSTALQRLGYSIDISSTARGSLIIKNWKPIPLENISDNPIVPVSDILGELTSVVTLRIVILRSKPSTYNEIKDKLLKLLVLQSHAVLRSTGCPLDESMLSQICRSSYQNSFSYNGDIPDELRRKFDQWWSNQLSPHSPIPTPKILPFMTGQSNDIDFPTPGHVAAAAAAAAVAAAGAANSTHSTLHNNREQLLAAAAAAESHHSTHHPAMMVHPALHSMHHSQYPNSAANQKTRMRTSFDPEMELPKLQRWFQENPHPSRQQIQSYVIQLNSLDSRRGRKPLDVNNVVYWFKNARAAQKRSEIRLHGIGNGYLKHDGHTNTNGSGNLSNSRQSTENMLLGGHSNYLKSSPNMKFDDIDNISQHSDDDDDIEEDDCTSSSRPNSPPQHLPLSLTMHERNRDSLSSNPSHENITIKSEIINGEIGSELSNSNNNDINGNNNSGNNSSSNNNNLSEPNNQSNDKNVNNSERISSDRNNIPEKNTNGDRNSERSSPNDQRDNNDRNSLNSHSNVNDNIHNNSMKSNNNNNNNNGNNSNINSSNDIEQQSNESPKNSLKSEEDLDMEDDNDISQMDDGFRSPSPDPRRDLAFPMVPNPMLSHSFMYMSHYMPSMGAGHHQPGAPGHVSHSAAAAAAAGLGSLGLGGPNGAGIIGSGNASGLNLSNLSNEERRKRNRTFIDPVTEVPKLEQWFALNTHPSHNQILKYTEDLNQMPYRQKFPRLESKNVQFWFKNRRAKCKRLKMSLYDSPQCSQLSQLSSLGGFGHNLKFDDRDSMTAHSMKYDDRDRME